MRSFTSVLVAGAAVLAAAASAPALAQSAPTHVMDVQLPDGGVAQIRYSGNVPPQVTFTTTPATVPVFAAMPSLFGGESPFAAMERISAEMDRQAAAMFRQVDAMTTRARTGQPIEVAFGDLPPGNAGYSYISTMSSNGVCTRSVEITSTGRGSTPRVVSHSSGNCGPTNTPGTGVATLPTATLPSAPVPPAISPKPVNRPDLLWTSADSPRGYAGLVRKVANAQR